MKLSKVSLSQYINQRGTGKPIAREDAVVYDFMPVVLGDQFRTDRILSKMLLRPAPEEGPFMVMKDAYEALGNKYLEKDKVRSALECYRIAMDSATGFAGFVSGIQESALLSPQEIRKMKIFSPLESRLIEKLIKERQADPEKYAQWVEELRAAKKAWGGLNMDRTTYGSREYVEACLAIGEYQEALSSAKVLRDRRLMDRVRQATPREFLDVKFLSCYMDDNQPESSIGR